MPSPTSMLWTAVIALVAVAIANRIPTVRMIVNNTAA